MYRFSIQAPSGRKARQINLIFYDTAGEDTSDEVSLVLFAHYLFHASGIIFLADPMAMPGIVNQLPYSECPRPLSSAQILNRVLSTLMQNNAKPGQKFSIPLAITLSKSDTLKYISNAAEYTFLMDVERNSPLERRELDIVSHEVQAVMRQFGDQNLLQIPQLCSNVEYFAIAATGCQVDNHGQYYAFIKPTHCLDPLIWILVQLGVLELA